MRPGETGRASPAALGGRHRRTGPTVSAPRSLLSSPLPSESLRSMSGALPVRGPALGVRSALPHCRALSTSCWSIPLSTTPRPSRAATSSAPPPLHPAPREVRHPRAPLDPLDPLSNPFHPPGGDAPRSIRRTVSSRRIASGRPRPGRSSGRGPMREGSGSDGAPNRQPAGRPPGSASPRSVSSMEPLDPGHGPS